MYLLGAQLHVLVDFLREAGEVLPQLSHAGLQLVPLRQQLVLLIDLRTQTQAHTHSH